MPNMRVCSKKLQKQPNHLTDMNKMYYLLSFSVLAFSACSGVTEKIGEGSEKAGRAVGEIARGVSSGVDQAFEIQPETDSAFRLRGLSLGKVQLGNDGEGTDNRLSVYLIAAKATDTKVAARVFDAKGLEMGRCLSTIKMAAGEARFVDFVFDKRTNIDHDSRVLLGIE
jgi:hypothetical protein